MNEGHYDVELAKFPLALLGKRDLHQSLLKGATQSQLNVLNAHKHFSVKRVSLSRLKALLIQSGLLSRFAGHDQNDAYSRRYWVETKEGTITRTQVPFGTASLKRALHHLCKSLNWQEENDEQDISHSDVFFVLLEESRYRPTETELEKRAVERHGIVPRDNGGFPPELVGPGKEPLHRGLFKSLASFPEPHQEGEFPWNLQKVRGICAASTQRVPKNHRKYDTKWPLFINAFCTEGITDSGESLPLAGARFMFVVMLWAQEHKFPGIAIFASAHSFRECFYAKLGFRCIYSKDLPNKGAFAAKTLGCKSPENAHLCGQGIMYADLTDWDGRLPIFWDSNEVDNNYGSCGLGKSGGCLYCQQIDRQNERLPCKTTTSSPPTRPPPLPPPPPPSSSSESADEEAQSTEKGRQRSERKKSEHKESGAKRSLEKELEEIDEFDEDLVRSMEEERPRKQSRITSPKKDSPERIISPERISPKNGEQPLPPDDDVTRDDLIMMARSVEGFPWDATDEQYRDYIREKIKAEEEYRRRLSTTSPDRTPWYEPYLPKLIVQAREAERKRPYISKPVTLTDQEAHDYARYEGFQNAWRDLNGNITDRAFHSGPPPSHRSPTRQRPQRLSRSPSRRRSPSHRSSSSRRQKSVPHDEEPENARRESPPLTISSSPPSSPQKELRRSPPRSQLNEYIALEAQRRHEERRAKDLEHSLEVLRRRAKREAEAVAHQNMAAAAKRTSWWQQPPRAAAASTRLSAGIRANELESPPRVGDTLERELFMRGYNRKRAVEDGIVDRPIEEQKRWVNKHSEFTKQEKKEIIQWLKSLLRMTPEERQTAIRPYVR